jgi:hypothetical protein
VAAKVWGGLQKAKILALRQHGAHRLLPRDPQPLRYAKHPLHGPPMALMTWMTTFRFKSRFKNSIAFKQTACNHTPMDGHRVRCL